MAEEFLYERSAALNHFFERVHEALTAQPYSIYFYLTFSKELIRGPHSGVGGNSNQASNSNANDSESSLELLRRTLKNIRDEDIEIFLHYSPEIAVQIVNDLIEEPSAINQAGLGPGGSAQRFQSNSNNNNNVGGGTSAKSGLSNAIDKETRSLALRIKKCPHYKSYKEYS